MSGGASSAAAFETNVAMSSATLTAAVPARFAPASRRLSQIDEGRGRRVDRDECARPERSRAPALISNSGRCELHASTTFRSAMWACDFDLSFMAVPYHTLITLNFTNER